MAKSATAIVFPFDCFGSAGTGDGAKLLGDALQEAINDEQLEDRETRPRSYTQHLTISEVEFNTIESLSAWRESGREIAKELLREKEFILWLSGNHLGVLPVFDELSSDTLVIQFDAHLDVYQLHDTEEELCHGNFLLHQSKTSLKIWNVGSRDLFLMPEDVEPTFERVIAADELANDFPQLLKQLKARCAKAKRIWLDLDLDAIDPAIAPAVHSPMPFGLTPQQLLAVIQAIWSEKVIGLSISEFDPGRDDHDKSLNLLGWLLEWVLLKLTGQ